MSNYRFISGADAVVKGVFSAGADVMFGYPITPTTEILQGWIALASKDKNLSYLQTEDEISAGFGVIGSLLAGKRAFSATAGPGTILMQDSLSMAENMRLPFVLIVMQRGGPSTGTVSYSQQEVNLSAFGGNGEGLRFVYSASTVEELYFLSAKIFSTAWKYRFPTILLGDGHLSKMKTIAKITPTIKSVKTKPILAEQKTPTLLRNCYSDESSFGEKLSFDVKDWKKAATNIAESEAYKTLNATEIIIAHGSVAETCKGAVDSLRKKGRNIGLFRPITIHPLDHSKLNKLIKKTKRIYIIESSLNQLSRIVKYSVNCKDCIEISKPAESFSSDEIAKKILSY